MQRIGKAFDVASESSNALISEDIECNHRHNHERVDAGVVQVVYEKSGMKMDTRKRASRRLLSLW